MHGNDDYRFCPRCGARLAVKRLKPGEPERLVCPGCRFVFYIDPKLAASVIVDMDGRVVLLRRGISPSFGMWVLPGGFVDAGETVAGAARREAREEAGLEVAIGDLVGVYSYPGVSVVIVVYEGKAAGGVLTAADETLEARLFRPDEIPWDGLAFTSTGDSLKDYFKKKEATGRWISSRMARRKEPVT